jgi:hypothetical protein
MPVADASLKLIADWTVPRILATLARRTEAIAARARAEFGIDLPSDRRAGHYLGLRFRSGVPADLPGRLAAEHVHVSVRGAAMRVTPPPVGHRRGCGAVVRGAAGHRSVTSVGKSLSAAVELGPTFCR